ncbi:methyl-accepting chemotaxis protein [Vibrio sp. AK197]
MSAKNKIILSIGALCSLVIVIIVAIGYNSFNASSTNNYTDKLSLQASLIAASAEQRMLRNFDLLKMAANAVDIDKDGNLNVDQLKQKIAFLESEYDIVASFFATADGTTYRNFGEIADFNAKAAGREWFTRIMSGETDVITTPYKASSGKIIMSLVEPVLRDGKIVGIMGANIALDGITSYLESLTESNQIFVSRADGYILSSKHADDIGQNLYELRPSFATYRQQNGAGHEYVYQGKSYFVVNAISQDLDWNIWSWESIDNIDAASADNLSNSSWLAVIAILVSLIVTYLLVDRLMYRPIGGEPTQIEDIVRKVAGGDLSLAGTARGNETGILAATLTMVTQLKETIKHIQSASEDINSSSTQMSQSSEQVKTSSESQMVQLEQAATAMNEMSASVDEVARHALKASDSAKGANGYSEQGMNLVSDMNQSIRELVTGIEAVVNVNLELEKETQSIGQILEVIDGISEQTNLLALNAAIEAARAGEHGRGFAVVADEVRSLANQTKESTTVIQETIHRLQAEASRSVEMMQVNMKDAQTTSEKSDLANQALQEIQTSVALIEDMNTQIAAAVEEQSHVASEIGSNVVEINDLAKSTMELTDNNHQSAQQLTGIARTLNKSIEIFKW